MLAVAAEVLEDPPDFGEDFSADTSVTLFGFGPVLAATTEDCLDGAGQAFDGLALDLAEALVSETGFTIFFFGVSQAALCAVEDLDPSLLSSFLAKLASLWRMHT